MTRRLSEKQWVGQIIEKYGAIEKRQPQTFQLAVDEWPEWVVNLWPTLLAISHPGLRVKSVKKWTARDLGQFLGRQSALEGLLWDEVPLSPRVMEEKRRWLDSQTDKIRSSHTLAVALTQDIMGLKKWRPDFKKFIDETLASARSRPYAESSLFLSAFGRANVIEPDELATERRMGVSERIAYVMVMMWRDIAKFESVARLHQLLSVAAKPMGVEITLKRIEKLCQRIGLKFKDRGRPRRKIQTNSPIAV